MRIICKSRTDPPGAPSPHAGLVLPPRRGGRTATTLAAVVLTACALIAGPAGHGDPAALPGLERGVPVLLLYIGPDMLLPFTSALGAVAGVLMIFWQRIVAIARRLWRLLLRRPT